MLQRFKRVTLLARCLIRALFYGKADKVPSGVLRVIVVPTGKLGDVVCNTPVLRAIRKYIPNAHIIVAGESKLHRPLLADSGLADEYLDLGESNPIARIKGCKAEAAIITGPSYWATAMMYAAGVPLVVAAKVLGGYSPSETRPYRILQKLIRTFPYRMGEYAPRERLRALEPLGIFADNTKKHLGFSKDADNRVAQFLVNNGIDTTKDFIVGISPSAGNKIKEWPADRFARVIDHLCAKHRARVLITGGRGDAGKASEVMKSLGNKTVAIDTSGKFSLDELKALISKLSLFISVDSGPIYIAEAFDVPTVDITGPIDEREQPPRGLFHRNVTPPERLKPELFVLNAKFHNREEALRQTLSISVSMVIDELDTLIADLKKRK